MPREIRSLRDVVSSATISNKGNNTASASNEPDDFKDRLVKLIPTEIVTAYITIQGLITGAGGAAAGTPTSGSDNTTGNAQTLLWIVFIVLTILTPIYLYFISKVRKWLQILFNTVAFIIWVIVIGGPIEEILGFPAEFIGSIILVIYTLLIPLVYKGE